MRKDVRTMKATPLAILLLAATSCTSAATSSETGATSVAPDAGASPAVNPAALTAGTYDPPLDPSNFVASITNPYFPLEPGTKFIYQGKTAGEPERVEVTVTSQTKTVAGIPCVVVRDQVFAKGELAEDTVDWYAQDQDGNVWYMGERTAEYENGKVTTRAGSWETGVDGAQPGVVMPANPVVGETYRQEYYPGEAEDQATVVALDGTIDTPYGSFDGAVVTEDINPLDPRAAEHKYYAPDVGFVYEEDIKGKPGSSALVEVTTSGS